MRQLERVSVSYNLPSMTKVRKQWGDDLMKSLWKKLFFELFIQPLPAPNQEHCAQVLPYLQLTSHPKKTHPVSGPTLAFGRLHMAHGFSGLERYNFTPTVLTPLLLAASEMVSSIPWDSRHQTGFSMALCHCPCEKKFVRQNICVEQKQIYNRSLSRACLKQNLIEIHLRYLQTRILLLFTFDIIS